MVDGVTKPYEYIEYPKIVYVKDGDAIAAVHVNDAAELEELGPHAGTRAELEEADAKAKAKAEAKAKADAKAEAKAKAKAGDKPADSDGAGDAGGDNAGA